MSAQDTIQQLQANILANEFRHLVSDITENCYPICIRKPGPSLDSYDQKCIANCMDRNPIVNYRSTMEISHLCSELKVLVERLEDCNVEEIAKNPSSILAFYPVPDPTSNLSIFDKIYSLLTPYLLTGKLRFRFLYLLNILLSSTKVPGYIIASYIKKLSRCSLSCKARTRLAILELVANLISRHPTLLSLRDNVDVYYERVVTSEDASHCTLRDWIESDPFDENEVEDLRKTRAMESCLWELMPLRFSDLPKLAEAAQFLNLPGVIEMEYDLSRLLR